MRGGLPPARAGAPAAGAAIERFERGVAALVAAGEAPLPPYPAVALRVQEAMGRRDVSLAEVAALVGADGALAADILRCANSAMYRRGAPVTALGVAVTRIGAQQVLRLLLASGLAAHAQAPGALAPLRRLFWIEGLASASLCQELARLRGLRTEEAFVLGLLHDFGKIVAAASLELLLERDPDAPSLPVEDWRRVVERQHVALGAAMASRWKLPALVGEVIAAHHGATAGCRDPGLLAVVEAADQVSALALGRIQVSEEDVAGLPAIAGAERAAVVRVVEYVPEFVAAFEGPPAPGRPPPSRIAAPETTLAGARPVKLGVSISVARRPRTFSATAVAAEGLSAQGEEPVPENRLLEAKFYGERPFGAWVLVRLCRPEGDGFRIEIRPFALSSEARALWDALVAGGPRAG